MINRDIWYFDGTIYCGRSQLDHYFVAANRVTRRTARLDLLKADAAGLRMVYENPRTFAKEMLVEVRYFKKNRFTTQFDLDNWKYIKALGELLDMNVKGIPEFSDEVFHG